MSDTGKREPLHERQTVFASLSLAIGIASGDAVTVQ